MQLQPTELSTAAVVLEPLSQEHRQALRAAAESGLDWTYMPIDASGAGFDDWFDWSLKIHEQRQEIVYTVRQPSDRSVVGSTRYLNIEPAHKRCEIGHTWYAPRAQGTAINPSAKFLLFSHAFEAGAQRVELKCDARNARSRAAIRKLGATEEGTLRRHMILPGGHVRDTVYHSVLAEEWPPVRERLLAHLGARPKESPARP